MTLAVTDETGAEAVATETITVNPPLQAVIEHSEPTGFAPVTVEFDATGSTGIAPLSYEWDFGLEDATSSEAETSFEFEGAGEYTVTLTVTDANGDTDTATTEIAVVAAAPVVAIIDASSTVGSAPLTVEFDATGSTGQGDLTYYWSFGDDGAESTDAITTHTFESNGIYTVDLTVRDGEGQEGTASVDIIVYAPTAVINAPDDIYVGYAATFDGTNSTGEGQLTFDWDFGDGNTGTGETVTHTYDAEGTFTVELTVTDGDNQSATVTESVAVIMPPEYPLEFEAIPTTTGLDYQWVMLGITNSATGSEEHIDDLGWSELMPVGDYELAVDFMHAIGIHSGPDGGYRYNAIMDYNSSVLDFTHSAPETVVSIPFQPDSGSLNISISGLPGGAPDPDYVLTAIAAPVEDIGDVVTSDLADLTPGVYDVTFGDVEFGGVTFTPRETTTRFAVDSNEATDIDILFAPLLKAEIQHSAAGGIIAGSPISFTASINGGHSPFTFEWDFGDGSTSTEENPEKTFTAGGEYTVTLTVRDDEGQEATTSVDIVVDSALASVAFHVFPSVPAVITVQDEHGNEYELGPDDHILQGIPAGDYTIIPNDYVFSNPTPPYTALYSAPDGLRTLEPGDDLSIGVTYEAVTGSLELSDSGLPGYITFADCMFTRRG